MNQLKAIYFQLRDCKFSLAELGQHTLESVNAGYSSAAYYFIYIK